jgi:flagellin
MKELATEASTTSPSRRDRAIMNAEFETLRAEIDSIAERTEFNDVKPLKGISLAFKVGTGNSSQDSITVSLSAATVASLDAGLVSDTIADASSASQALTDVTSAIDALKDIQASVDGATVRFQSARQYLASDKQILTAQRKDMVERPVTIGTADHLANLVRQEYLSKAVPAAAGKLSSGSRVLLSSSRIQPLGLSRAEDRTPSQEEAPVGAVVKRTSAYEAAQNTGSSSSGETAHSVDIEA